MPSIQILAGLIYTPMRKLSKCSIAVNTAEAFFFLLAAAEVCCVMDEAGLGGSGVNSIGGVEDVVVDSGGPRRSGRLRASGGQSAGRLVIWPLAAILATLFQHGVVAPADYSHQGMFGFMLDSLPGIDPTLLPAGFAVAEVRLLLLQKGGESGGLHGRTWNRLHLFLIHLLRVHSSCLPASSVMDPVPAALASVQEAMSVSVVGCVFWRCF